MVRTTNIAGWAVVAVCLAWLALARPAAAQDTLPGRTTEPRWTIRPAFYFSNTDGRTTIGSRSGAVEMEDSVLVVNWTGQVEYHDGGFGVVGDVSYSTTSNVAELEPDGSRAAYDFRILTADLAVGYRLGAPEGRADMLLLAGARYFRTEQRLADSTSGVAIGRFTEDWLQPLIGARGQVRLADPLEGWVRFDVGARVASSGQAAFAWLLNAGLDYAIFGPAGLTLQYRYLQLDTGVPGARRVAYDGPSQGWILGLSLQF